jgi:anaerobic ribonucleoside-triphosphate reductase activating protein
MHYSEVYPYDLVNGVGVRFTVFLSGCIHHCKGCFNQKTLNPTFGTQYTQEFEDSIITALKDTRRVRDGISLLGGDPMFIDNIPHVIKLMQRIKLECPSKNIWLWTGYTIEEIRGNMILSQCLKYIDVLIDGRFEMDLKSASLPFRGSTNQRILYKGIDYE